MTEVIKDVMNLIGSEVQDSTSLKLSFSVNKSKLPYKIKSRSREFDIHNIAQICFLLQRLPHDSNYVRYYTMVRKHNLAKNLVVKLRVVCNSPEINQQISCSDKWGEEIYIGDDNNMYFHILINFTVSKGDNNMKLYEDDEFTDFKLTTDEGSLAVHKALLAANSDVFKLMLRQEWKEASEGFLKLEGLSLQTLKNFKQYMYLGTLPKDGLLPLLLIATCYLMDDLKAQCLMKISQTFSSENLDEVIQFSLMYKNPELLSSVMETMPKHIVKNACEIMINNTKFFRESKEKVKEEEDNSNSNDNSSNSSSNEE